MSNKIIVSVIVLILASMGGYFLLTPGGQEQATVQTDKKEDIRIGFSLGTLQEARWQKDADYFVQRAQELGATVEVKYSGGNSDLQISQAENLIIGGAQVLVVVPSDSVSANKIVETAHKAGVKVISYDRMIEKSDVDLYMTFDSREVGKMQAEEVLKVAKGNVAYIGGSETDNNAFLLKEGSMKVADPFIKDGTAKIVLSSFSPGWRPEEAYKTMKAYLSSNKKIDAVIAANDGTAGGVIQALDEFGLAGKVPVSGQDAELQACRRIVAGTQTMTVYKSFKQLAYAAAEAAVALVKGEKPVVNGTMNNGKIEVQSHFLTPVLVNKQNIDSTVIADGVYTKEEIYYSLK